ncbi:MAG: nucleotidyltransferase family protein, partial [Clostridia bacterium]|nr:nucleotidyltransferase family protein [Clostridia bacterium]
YSHAKLRRAVAAAALGVPAGMPEEAVPYLRVLAFGERGRMLLRSLKETATLPLCQSGRECEQANAAFFGVERLATDLRNCWAEQPLPGGADYRNGAVYCKNPE